MAEDRRQCFHFNPCSERGVNERKSSGGVVVCFVYPVKEVGKWKVVFNSSIVARIFDMHVLKMPIM